jgi:hypothetical protein
LKILARKFNLFKLIIREANFKWKGREINKLQKYVSVTFQQLSFNFCLLGNERADKLAKRAATKQNISAQSVDYYKVPIKGIECKYCTDFKPWRLYSAEPMQLVLRDL